MSDARFAVLFVIGLSALTAAAFAIAIAVNGVMCAERWRDSGASYRFSALGGCQVQMPDGRWLPEQVLRQVGEQ